MTTDQRPDTGPLAWFRRTRSRRLALKIGVGVVGGLVLVAGILMIPYPGPGWLVVFTGLAILATEFTWAERVLKFAKGYYDKWVAWLKRQNLLVKALVIAGTCAIVLVTCWLLGAFALVGGWFGLDWPWLASPIFGHGG
ncbi:TIGR02611 family protein [Actinosynnema sp. NPDC020468]|uniref:TIGR02611 family protein n=1 Tax=Actinosynnema sp. NPDC020468 TaxID=3154488 RepID=UPI00340E59F7